MLHAYSPVRWTFLRVACKKIFFGMGHAARNSGRPTYGPAIGKAFLSLPSPMHMTGKPQKIVPLNGASTLLHPSTAFHGMKSNFGFVFPYLPFTAGRCRFRDRVVPGNRVVRQKAAPTKPLQNPFR